MTNNVHALFYSQPAGLGFGFATEQLKGLFETRELAEKRLLEIVLDGGMIAGARIDELTVEKPFDPRDPLNYPEVIASLIEFKKIQAIKHLREKVDGLFLKEAKDLVEAVNLDKLPEDVKAAALKVLEERGAAARAQAEEEARQRNSVPGVGEPFEPVSDWMWSNWLRDEDDDWWGHTGDGLYVMVNSYGERDNWASPQAEDDLDDSYVIVKRQDERPEFDARF